MFKYQKILQKSSVKKGQVLWHPKRTQYTGNPEKSNFGSKLILGCAALTGITTVGFVGFVSSNNKNRQKVENVLPPSRYLLNMFMGPLPEIEQPSISTSPSQEVGLLQKKLDRERNKIVEEIETDEIQPPTLEEIPPLPNVNELIDVDGPLPSQTPGEEMQNIIEKEPAQQNNKEPLTALLDNLISDARKHSLDAMATAEEATTAIHKYFENAYHAIDTVEGRDDLYAAASNAANLKEELIQKAEEKLSVAKQTVSNLRSTIEEVRQKSDTVNEDIISNANEVVNEIAHDVATLTSIVAEAIKDCTALGELHDLVEEGRKQFETEVKSLVPNIKIGGAGDKMSTDELNLLLAHAHKKVILLQGALARHQTVDKNKATDSDSSTDYDSRFADAKLKTELEKQKHDLSTLHRHRISEMREELESQLHGQLKRQAAAHSDHLADALRLQESEMNRRWQNVLHDSIQQKQAEYYTALTGINGQLDGLKEGIHSRAKVNEEAVKSHQLWVACEALKSRLRLNNGLSWEEKIAPLKENIEAIKKAAGDEKEFIQVVISALPKESISRGVYTEEALKERFIKVERICRRVAMIGEGGGSMVRYFISYLQSFFLANSYDLLTMEDMNDEEVDITELSTFDILAKTKYCLDKDDFLQSVKYMKLLRGEPRNVAADWVREVLLTTEARQVADVLMAFAAATVGRSL